MGLRMTVLGAIGTTVILFSIALGWNAAGRNATRPPAPQAARAAPDTLTLRLSALDVSVPLPQGWRPVPSGTPGVAAARHPTAGAVSLGLTGDPSPAIGARRARRALAAAGVRIESHGALGHCAWLAASMPAGQTPVRLKMNWSTHQEGTILTSWSLRANTDPPERWGRGAGAPEGHCQA